MRDDRDDHWCRKCNGVHAFTESCAVLVPMPDAFKTEYLESRQAIRRRLGRPSLTKHDMPTGDWQKILNRVTHQPTIPDMDPEPDPF